jgi:hypothetical protein
MAKLEQDDFQVTEQFATKILIKNENKLLPTIKHIKDNITLREARLHNTGRISVPFERVAAYQMVEMYNAMNLRKGWGANTRDTILESLELEEQALRSTDPNAWKMLFSLKHTGYDGKKEGEEHAKQMHAGEKKYREERSKAWKEIKKDKTLSSTEVEKRMQVWEDQHAAPGTFGRVSGGVGSSYRRAYITPDGDPVVGDSEDSTFYEHDVDVEAYIDGALAALKRTAAGSIPTTNIRSPPILAKIQVPKTDNKQSKSKTPSAVPLGTPAMPAITVTPSSSDPEGPEFIRLVDPDGKHEPQYYVRCIDQTGPEGVPVVEAPKKQQTTKSVKQRAAEIDAAQKQEIERKMHEKLMKSLPTDAIPLACSISVGSETKYAPHQRVPLMPLDFKFNARLLGKAFFDARERPLAFRKNIPDVMIETDAVSPSTSIDGDPSKWSDHATVGDMSELEPQDMEPVFETVEAGYAREFEHWKAEEQERLELMIKHRLAREKEASGASPVDLPQCTKSPLHATVEDAKEDDEEEPFEPFHITSDQLLERLVRHGKQLAKANAMAANEEVIEEDVQVEPVDLDSAEELNMLLKNSVRNVVIQAIVSDKEMVDSVIARNREETITPSELTHRISAAPRTETETEEDEFDSIFPIIERDTLLSRFFHIMGPFLGEVTSKEPSEKEISFVMSWGVRIRALAKTLISLCGGSAPCAALIYKEFAFPEAYAAFLKHNKKLYRRRDLEHFAVDVEIFEWANLFMDNSLVKQQMAALAAEHITIKSSEGLLRKAKLLGIGALAPEPITIESADDLLRKARAIWPDV